MPGIYIASIISTSLVLAAWGTLILRKANKSDRLLLILLFTLQLPMSALIYYLVRVPLDAWYAGFLIKGSKLYLIAKSFEAPLTEEPAKLLPLLIPFIFHRIHKQNGLLAGMALGLGFGVSEIWTLSYLFAHGRPSLLAYPWYHFLGGIQERFIASFLHAVMTGLAVYGISQGVKKAFSGIGTAMFMHYSLNFPIFFPLLGIVHLRKDIWLNILSLYGIIIFLVALHFIWKKLFGKSITLTFWMGKSSCPSCKIEYEPTLWSTLNFGVGTYQRCPHCKKWHFFMDKFWKKKKQKRTL